MTRQKQAHDLHAQMVPRWQDLLVTLLILAAGTAIGNIFWQFAFTKANIISVYVLGTLLTSLFTKSYFCGVFSSVVSVLLFNFFFTEPRLTLHAYEKGYPFTIAIMLIVSIITVTLAIQNIRNIEEKERAALLAIMTHATGRTDWTFPEAALKKVCVTRLTAKTLTCKEHT